MRKNVDFAHFPWSFDVENTSKCAQKPWGFCIISHFPVELLLRNVRIRRPKEGMGRFPPPGELKLPRGSNTSTQGVDGFIEPVYHGSGPSTPY